MGRDCCKLGVLVVLLGTAPAVRAHDIWLVPDQCSASAGESVRLEQRAGHRLRVERRLPVLEQVTTRFDLITTSGVRDLLQDREPRARSLPRLRAADGIALVVMEHAFAETELPGKVFRDYVAEEGLTGIVESLKTRDPRPVERERYARSMQVLLRFGGDRDRYPQVRDDDLRFLQGLTRLRGLDLAGTGITDDGLAQLSGLVGLRRLDLSGTRITDAGLRHLRPLVHLRELRVGGTGTTEEGLRALGDRQELRIVRDGTDDRESSMPVLNPLPPRVDLRLLDNPFLLDAGGVLRVRASLDGTPLDGQTVWAYRADGERLAEAVEARTDADGVARLRLGAAGFWLARYVHMRPAPPEAGVDWESFWACFAFEVD